MFTSHPQLPSQPYPGLRPFLAFEAPLLFGRERQVEEIVDKLAHAQFVAVLGGSGSGKSSLTIAGVLPQLRSHGIAGAGDLWLPMVCTPGSNAAGVSPVTRLAGRFARLLRTRGSPEGDAQRLDEIAAVFRQEAGLARLLDAFEGELDLPPGADAAEARLLVVIDQFEEVFHPTNAGSLDAQLLVERVLDHFYAPHPRCYVVLTMRSEFLNACAAFIELPDAINRASYLVRRMNPDELRQAITGPAQRFLRLVVRSGADGDELPREVQFDPAVLDRVISDAQAIAGDPDHLPLLQHLLARAWQSARAREANGLPVPARISVADLACASGAPGATEMPGPETNTLRASLENWAEVAWAEQPEAARAALQLLLPRLALRDPNTGQYSQQRLAVADAARLLGPDRSAAAVHQLLEPGFIGGVDYIFWDDSDPAQATIKPSHESFIRGWRRFRQLVDQQARRIEALRELLRSAQAWAETGGEAYWLLEAGAARRLLDESRVEELLDDQPGVMRLLALDADTRGLALPLEQLHAYIGASRRHLREQVLRQRRRRLVAVASIFSMLLPVLLFAVIVQMPTLTRVTRMVEASSAALAAQQPDPDDAPAVTRTALVPLMAAAAQMDGARSGRGVALSAGADAIFRHLPFLPGVRSLGDLLRTVGEQSEAVINPRLRATLAQATGSHAANPWTTLVAGSDAGVVQAARRAPEGSACHTLATRLESFGIKRAAPLELPGHCLLVGRDAQGPTGERMAAVYRRTEDPVRSPSPMLWAPLGAITNLPADGGAPADWQFASAGPRAGWLLVRVPRAGGAAQAWGLPLSTCALWRAARAIVSGGEDCASP